MSGFLCPYCSMVMPISQDTFSAQYPCFSSACGYSHYSGEYQCEESCIQVNFYKCPNCKQYTIIADGKGNHVRDVNIKIRPTSSARKFPSYIPDAIRQDYEEACAIVQLSPKASATLSRRCLQGMIRDFWKISESNLYKEIDALKDKISPKLWDSINSLRQLGNIGAHMEKDTNVIVDIEPQEAESLIKLIEHLMKEWYIGRHDQELLLNEIISINNQKQSDRKGNE